MGVHNQCRTRAPVRRCTWTRASSSAGPGTLRAPRPTGPLHPTAPQCWRTWRAGSSAPTRGTGGAREWRAEGSTQHSCLSYFSPELGLEFTPHAPRCTGGTRRCTRSGQERGRGRLGGQDRWGGRGWRRGRWGVQGWGRRGPAGARRRRRQAREGGGTRVPAQRRRVQRRGLRRPRSAWQRRTRRSGWRRAGRQVRGGRGALAVLCAGPRVRAPRQPVRVWRAMTGQLLLLVPAPAPVALALIRACALRRAHQRAEWRGG